uniref:Uncharacterized protein LOC111109776 n=1 Tax=Crassostrea virginica TaxID=6565 RepID=A0A8B8BF92_CRAVI|nr:uncharacterized protein LOC111109776 [Crassostrea virginica]
MFTLACIFSIYFGYVFCHDGIFLNSSTYCYTGVKMFSNPHLLTVVPSIPVYAISTEDRNQIVYSVSKTDLNGQACILTPCFGNIKLVVESKRERAFAAATNKQQITSMLFYNVSDYMDHIVVDIDQSLKGIGNDTGPVYIDKEECKRGRQYFLFHFQGLSGKLMTNPYAEEHDYRTSWNPTFPRKSCFVKVQIQTKSKSLGIIANSYDESGYWFGTFVAPLHGNHNGKRAACIEFRCPVYDSLNEEIPTILNADMPGSSNCTLISVSDELESSTLNATDTSFTGIFRPGSHYGSNVGVYVDKSKNALFSCYGGKFATESNYLMNPEVGIALRYNCS